MPDTNQCNIESTTREQNIYKTQKRFQINKNLQAREKKM